jgi:hypothetical protein
MLEPQAAAATCHFVGFCTLKSADQAAWAGAIGSFFAALVALGIAVSGGVGKALQRRKDGRALAAYIHADLYRAYDSLEKAIAKVDEFKEGRAVIGVTPDALASFVRDIGAGMFATILSSKVDQFGKLPFDIGEELAAAVGSMGVARAAVERFLNVLTTPIGKQDEFCGEILDKLLRTRRNMERAVAYCRKVVREG